MQNFYGENNIKSHHELYDSEREIKKKNSQQKRKKKKEKKEENKSFHVALTYSRKTIKHILNQTLIKIYFAVLHVSIHTFTPC